MMAVGAAMGKVAALKYARASSVADGDGEARDVMGLGVFVVSATALISLVARLFAREWLAAKVGSPPATHGQTAGRSGR